MKNQELINLQNYLVLREADYFRQTHGIEPTEKVIKKSLQDYIIREIKAFNHVGENDSEVVESLKELFWMLNS